MFAYNVLLFAAFAVAAVPPAPVLFADAPSRSLQFLGRLNNSGQRIPDIDRARAANHLARGKNGQQGKRQSSVPATNQAVEYIAQGLLHVTLIILLI